MRWTSPHVARELVTGIAFLGLLALSPTPPSTAATLGPGNLIVTDSSRGTLTEYTPAGAIVQTFTLSPQLGSEMLRDVVADSAGNLHAFNGTFAPSLSTIETATGSQTDTTSEPFSSSNVLGYGSVAATAGQVFVSDTENALRTDNGIISFNTVTGFTPTRFATDFAPIDLTIGADGFLYALGDEGTFATTPAELVNVYDPNTRTRVDQITLPMATAVQSVRSLTADAAGMMYITTFDDRIQKLDRAGNVIDTLVVSDGTSPPDLADIDIAPDGRIAAASTNGTIFLTDTSLSSFTQFSANTGGSFPNYYVGFTDPIVAVPEPNTIVGLLLLAGVTELRRKR